MQCRSIFYLEHFEIGQRNVCFYPLIFLVVGKGHGHFFGNINKRLRSFVRLYAYRDISARLCGIVSQVAKRDERRVFILENNAFDGFSGTNIVFSDDIFFDYALKYILKRLSVVKLYLGGAPDNFALAVTLFDKCGEVRFLPRRT